MKNFSKSFGFFFILYSFFFQLPLTLQTHAQVTTCWVTQFGNPPDRSSIQPGCDLAGGPIAPIAGQVNGPCGPVVAQDAKIIPLLRIGSNGYYSYMPPKAYSNCGWTIADQGVTLYGSTYWCANSIIDAYNLAGLHELNPKYDDQFVVYMHMRWLKISPAKGHLTPLPSSYFVIDYDPSYSEAVRKAAILQVRPGYPIFWEGTRLVNTGSEHVGLIAEVKITDPVGGYGYFKTWESNSGTNTIHTHVISRWNILNSGHPTRGFGGHT